MTIRNTILIIIIVLSLAALASGAVVYFQNRPTTSLNANANATPIVTENANSAAVPTTPVTAGDITVNKSFTAHDTSFTIETALQTDAFRRKQASEGMKFVVLFLKAFDQNPSTDPLSWAGSELRLSSGGAAPVVPTEISIPNRANVSGGYLWFTVPDISQGFTLVVGSGAALTNVALGF